MQLQIVVRLGALFVIFLFIFFMPQRVTIFKSSKIARAELANRESLRREAVNFGAVYAQACICEAREP